nr:carboxypeptidase regulatory-like domain-containing protein [Candidatus Cloacimonadota bacterium]
MKKYLISLTVIGFLCATSLFAQDDLWPPLNLEATDNLIGVINLNWDSPIDSAAIELSYDDNEAENYYYVEDPLLPTHHMAVGFTYPEDCWVHTGRFYMSYDPGATDFDYNLFGGTAAGPDASNVLASGTCTLDGDPNGDWYDIDLGRIAITGGDWFYLDVQYRDDMTVNTDCYYVAGDESDPNPYSWYTLDGTNWFNLGAFVNATLRTVVSTISGKSVVLNPIPTKSHSSTSIKQLANMPRLDDELLAKFTSRPYARPKTRVVRANFENYNIYREDVLIGTSDTEFYVDSDIDYETWYEYYVTAQYIEGEPNPTNHVMGYTVALREITEIGNAEITDYQIPMNIFYENSITETVYDKEWIGTAMFLHTIGYHANISTPNIPPFNLEVWIGEIDVDDLSGGWIDGSQLTLCYDGMVDTPAGDYWCDIVLDTPFEYTHTHNLVIMVIKDHFDWYSTSDTWWTTESGTPYRTIHDYDDFDEFNAMNPPTNPYDKSTYPDIRLHWTPFGTGDVDGTVTNADTGDPIEGAVVSIMDNLDVTGPDGTYLLEDIPIGLRDITCVADGYYDAADVVEVLEDQTVTVDFALNPLIYGTLDGTVIDDSTGLPIEGAEINAVSVGDWEYDTTTDEFGYYIIDEVVVGTYDVTCSADGYWTETEEDVIIEAGVTTTVDFALILYTIPDSYFSDFEDDDGGLLSNDPGGWQWGAPTSGPMAAYSGVNVWATVLSGDYTPSANWTLETTQELIIASGAYMLEFWHWYDMEASYDGGNVKISTDGGATWTVIEPIGGYPGMANSSNPLYPEPIYCGHDQGFWEKAEFDLSAYSGQVVFFRWHFGSDSSVQYPGWYIDNVRIYEQEWGSLEGYVTELSTGASIEGAEIIVGGQYTGYSDDTGYYLIEDIVAFNYDITCTAEGYNDALEEDFEILADIVNTLNFEMTAPTMDIDPLTINEEIAPDDSLTTYLTVSNNGNGTLDWHASTQYPDAQIINIPVVSNYFSRTSEPPSMGMDLGENRKRDKEYLDPVRTDILRGSTAWFRGGEYSVYFYGTFDTDFPGDMTEILSPPAWAAYCGDYSTESDEYFYVNNPDDFNIYTVDAVSGIATLVGPTGLGAFLNGMACDKTDGTMYAVDGSNLYTIDLTIGAATLVGPIGNPGGLMINLACDGDGNLWGIDIGSDDFWFIDKTTGAGTYIGITGFDANYAQSMAWDPETDVIFWAAYGGGLDGNLRVVDRTTGATAFVGDFEGGREVTVLAFPGRPETWLTVEPRTGTIEAGNDFDVSVIFNSEGIPPGTTLTADIIFTSDPDVGTETVDVNLTVGTMLFGSISGTVTLESFPPYCTGNVEDVIVTAGSYWANPDATGYYLLEAYPNTYDVTASLYGFEDSTIVDVVVLEDQNTPDIDFYLNCMSGGLSGYVTDDSTGLSIEGATVTVLGAGPERDLSDVTDEFGYYEIIPIVAGTYDVTCSADGYWSQTEEGVIIETGVTTTLDFALVLYTIPDYYFSDFEDDDGGLLSNDPSGWQWGVPTSGPPAAYSGVNVWGTVLNGNYVDNANWTLETTQELIIATGAYMLEFWQWYNTENSWDGGNVKISTDFGATWQVIYPVGGYPDDAIVGLNNEPGYTANSGGWVKAEFDLSAYAGEIVHFRWHFGTDSSVHDYPGWYIDDVRVYEQEWGSLEGYVTELSTGAPIENAVITVGTQYTGTSGNDGYYLIEDIVAFTYDITCEAEGYNDALEEDFEILADIVNTLDFEMTAPTMEIDPLTITETVDMPGDSVITYITVSNNGDGPLDWNASITSPEAQRVPQIPSSSGHFPMGNYKPSIDMPPEDGVATVESSAPIIDFMRGATAYGIEAANDFFCSFDVDEPEVLNNIASYTGTDFSNAGDFGIGDQSFVYELDNVNNLRTIDLETGAATVIGNPLPVGAETWTGMSTDPTTGTIYGCTTDIYNSSLFTIDPETATSTFIGSIGFPGVIDIAVDGNGDMWGYCLVQDEFFSIDKETGLGTLVGSIGFDANFGQGMTWDVETDQLYMCAFNNATFQPELRIVDRETGNTVMVGVLGATSPGGLCQLGWMAIPGFGGPQWITVDPTSGTVPAGDFEEVEVKIKWIEEIVEGTILNADINFSSDPDVGEETVPVTATFGGIPPGSISGIVTLEDTDYSTGNVEDVVVTALSASGGSYSTSPDDTGYYILEEVYVGIYDVTAILYGYEDSTIVDVEVDSLTNTPNIDFDLNCLFGALTGEITDFDTGLPIEVATVTIFDTELSDDTDEFGVYLIVDVVEGSYSVQASHDAYVTVVHENVQILQDIENIEDFVLQEVGLPTPRNLQASEDNPDGILVEWLPPAGGGGEEWTEGFESGVFPPVGWEHIQTHPVTTWTLYDDPTYVYEGTYSAGCWWDYGHQDEWLITPEFGVDGSSTLEFWSYAYQGSTYGDHYYVRASTDGGATWSPDDILLDMSALTGGWNYYVTPYIIDLSAYAGEMIKLAWHAEDPPDNDGMWWAWLIDAISVTVEGELITFGSSDLTHERHGAPVVAKVNNTPTRDGTPVEPRVIRDRDFMDMYNLYRGEVSGGPYPEMIQEMYEGTEYLDTDVALGEIWYYVATALYDTQTPYEESPYSNEDWGTLYNDVPPPPENVSVTGVDDQVTINWDEVVIPEDDIDYYNVYKQYMNEEFEIVGTPEVPPFDYTLVDGQGLYYFYVTTVDLIGQESNPSETVEYIYGTLPPMISVTSGVDEGVPIYVAPWGSAEEYTQAWHDGTFESQIGCGGGCALGVRFTPIGYPADITHLELTFQGDANCTSAIVSVYPDPEALIQGPPEFPTAPGDPSAIWESSPMSFPPGTYQLDLPEGVTIEAGDVYVIVWENASGFLGIANDLQMNYLDRNWVYSTSYPWVTIFEAVNGDPSLTGNFGITTTFYGAIGQYTLNNEPEFAEADSKYSDMLNRCIEVGKPVDKLLRTSISGVFEPVVSIGEIRDAVSLVISENNRELTRDLTGYNIYKSEIPEPYDWYLLGYLDAPVGEPRDTVDTDVINDNEYWYYATAIYNNTDESDPSEILPGTPHDGIAPGPVTDLEYEISVPNLTVSFTWLDPVINEDETPCTDLEGIEIWRDGSLIETVEPGVQFYVDTVPEEGTYSYSFIAFDEVPNYSEPVDRIIWVAYILFAEDFSQGIMPPTGWSITGDYPNNWAISNTNDAGGEAPEGEFNWDEYGYVGTARLVTPIFNTVGMLLPDFEFKFYYSHWSNSVTIGVATTSDGGATWNTAWSMVLSGDYGPETVTFDITTPDVGSPNFQLCLFFTGDPWDIFYWHFDDIICPWESSANGNLSGEVIDLEFGFPIADAAVTIAGI